MIEAMNTAVLTTEKREKKRIPLRREHEVAYLALKLQCTEEQIKEAMARVGDNRFLLKRYIQDKWHSA